MAEPLDMRSRLRINVCLLAIPAAITGCTGDPGPPWSGVETRKDGSKSIGTPGLALTLGASGRIKFDIGPEAAFIAPHTPTTENDGALAGPAVGIWTLEKQDTVITLPASNTGFVKTYDYYENVDTEVWALLTTPGCATLNATMKTSYTGNAALVHRKYRLCAVNEAAERLRADGKS